MPFFTNVELDLMLIAVLLLVWTLLVLFVVYVSLRRLTRRYEQFRTEAGDAFQAHQQLLDDHDMRLTAAGYPAASALPQQGSYLARGPR